MKTFASFGIDTKGKNSGEVKTICPQCSPTRTKKNYPCLNVNIDKGVWHCWHCDWRGILNPSKGDFMQTQTRKIYRKPEPIPSLLSADWKTWLSKRGIADAVINRNRITCGNVYFPQTEGENPAIRFPYYRNNELVNVKSRDLNKNFRMESGAERIIYGIDDIDNESLIWVEGEVDKLTIETCGFKSCVSVPDGAPSPETKNYSNKFEFLDSAHERITQVKKHIIAVDSDKPGQCLQMELARRLGVEKCFIVNWPEGCKDANEVLMKYGIEGVKWFMEGAKPFPIAGIFSVMDITERVLFLYENGQPRGKTTGWRNLDDHYTVREGEWTVITGIPGHGKSEFLDALMVNLARNHGWRFAVCSPENQPLENHTTKILEKIIGKPFNPGATPRMDIDEMSDGLNWMNEHFDFVLPDKPSIVEILDRARILVKRNGIRGLVIDPWNEVETDRPPQFSETEWISRSLTMFRKFARENNVHVWIVAHPTKLTKDRITGKYPIPTPYDISGSAHWRNKADNAVTVWRNMENNSLPVEIHVQKVRFKVVGKVGAVNLYYDNVTGRYFDNANFVGKNECKNYYENEN